mmetsp:Transcript_716/g.1142  ORF Transcript_716/g.1142 Transcript_716/m.1142 type:complete len:128 (-) Transcript_716:142-525(-)
MPHIIIKKTFKYKPSGFKVAIEKNFSLHGAAVTPELVHTLNQGLGVVQCVGSAKPIQFQMSRKNNHYTADMHSDFLKYNEEDAVVALLDTMEVLGWKFRFEYDAELVSAKVAGGSSMTKREVYIFSK